MCVCEKTLVLIQILVHPQGNEGRLYEFIVRHFLACVSQDALGQETVVEIDIAEEKFSASGLMIIARNYLDVYPYDRWSTKVGVLNLDDDHTFFCLLQYNTLSCFM